MFCYGTCFKTIKTPFQFDLVQFDFSKKKTAIRRNLKCLELIMDYISDTNRDCQEKSLFKEYKPTFTLNTH